MGEQTDIVVGSIVRLRSRRIEAVDYHPQLLQIAFEAGDPKNYDVLYISPSAEFIGLDAEPQLIWEYSDDNMRMDSKTGLEFHVLEVLDPGKKFTYHDGAHLNTGIGARNYDTDKNDVTVNYRLYCYQKGRDFKKTGRYYRVPAEKHFVNIESAYFDALFMEDDLLSGHNKEVTVHTKTLEYSLEQLDTVSKIISNSAEFPAIHVAGVVSFIFDMGEDTRYEVIIDDRGTKVIIPDYLCILSNHDEVMALLHQEINKNK